MGALNAVVRVACGVLPVVGGSLATDGVLGGLLAGTLTWLGVGAGPCGSLETSLAAGLACGVFGGAGPQKFSVHRGLAAEVARSAPGVVIGDGLAGRLKTGDSVCGAAGNTFLGVPCKGDGADVLPGPVTGIG